MTNTAKKFTPAQRRALSIVDVWGAATVVTRCTEPNEVTGAAVQKLVIDGVLVTYWDGATRKVARP